MTNEIDRLKQKFIDEVLSKWDGFTKSNRLGGMYGIDPSSFTFNINPESIPDVFPHLVFSKDRLIHFTSLEKCLSILRSRTFRMYNLNSMKKKDETEFSMVANLFLEENHISNIKNQIFIASFCDPSLLKSVGVDYLWNEYGDNHNGCAIEFEIKNANSIPRFSLCKVDYSEPNLMPFKEALLSFDAENGLPLNRKDFFRTMACLYKKSNPFSLEHEVRMFHFDHIRFGNPTFYQIDSYCALESNEHGYKMDENGNMFYEIDLDKLGSLSNPGIRIVQIHLGKKVLKEEHEEIYGYCYNEIRII
jgi:hypothetical protein